MRARPQLPTLAEVLAGQTVKHSYSYRVPFLAVEDSGLSDAQRLKLSPSYIVQRTDEFIVQQQYLNGPTGPQSFTSQVAEGFPRPTSRTSPRRPASRPVITAKGEGGALITSTEMSFSLRLSQTFTYGFQRSQTTSTTTRTFPVTVPPGKLTVLWSMQSSFRVFRSDGSGRSHGCARPITDPSFCADAPHRCSSHLAPLGAAPPVEARHRGCQHRLHRSLGRSHT